MREMGRENELLQLVKLEDVAGVTRLLNKKPKLLGTGRRMNLNAQDAEGMSALHHAALLGNLNISLMLLEGGTYVDLKENRGMRALHLAAWQGQAELVSLLVQWNSSVNETAYDGSTPLHLACQYGHLDAVERLLCGFHANPTILNQDNRTPFDLACEFGRLQIVELVVRSNQWLSLLEERAEDTADNTRTTCLHLAAKNGHLDVIRCLLRSGVMDINRATLRGTCLHEAALYGRFEVVKLLLESGVDVNKPNSYDQTALDIVKTMTSSSRAGRDIRQLLKEACESVQAVTVKDFHPQGEPQGLSLREGEYVTVLEQREDGRWRGVVFGDGYSSRSGYFPSSAVALLNKQVGGGGMQQPAPSSRCKAAKKVAPPVIPGTQQDNRNCNRASTTSTLSPSSRDMCSDGMYILSSGSSSPVHHHSLVTSSYSSAQVAQVFVGGRVAGTLNSPHPSDEGFPAYGSQQGGGVGVFHHQQTTTLLPTPVYHQQSSLEDQGIDVQSPGRDSPGSSGGSSSGSGCRHSITSLDSGRASSSAYDGRCGHVFLAGTNQQHRLSGHSYESSTSLRQSYHSSTSSLGSMDRLDQNTPTSPNYSPAQINVSKLLRDGLPEAEVLCRWLSEQRFEEYFHLFVQAGYDMPTISRMTPEDLTAIGITNPSHRKKLKVEIGKLNISDGLPDYIPSSLEEWLRVLRLDEYSMCLQQQGYSKVSELQGIAWEDLEEIGIQRLGHQKKMMLAIKRLKDIQAGVKRFSTSNNNNGSSSMGGGDAVRHVQPLEVKCQVISPPANNTSSSVLPFQPYVESGGEYIPRVSAVELTAETYSTFNGYAATMSPSHLIYRPDIVAIQVRHPSGARSLENLEDNRENRHQTFLQTDNNCRWLSTTATVTNSQNVVLNHQSTITSQPNTAAACAWRRGSLDDGDITPTNESVYEMEGGGTLPRPKVSIKPRPVAKIMAKTRLPNGGSDGELAVMSDDSASDILKIEELKPTDGCVTVAEVHNSPRRSLPASPMNSVFRNVKKIPPPPPPKRTNSINEKRPTSDYSNEQLFASCVKSIANKFGLARKSGEWSGSSSSGGVGSGEKKLESPSDEGSDLSLEISESPDRTPPSPAPGSPIHQRCHSTRSSSPFLPKRSEASSSFESVASSNSSSSSNSSGGGTESSGCSNLPFANENVGTIKQRAIKPHPPLTKIDLGPSWAPNSNASAAATVIPRSAPATPRRRSSLKGCPSVVITSPNSLSTSSPESQDTDRNRSSLDESSGDVLSDIDNMLANLSEELDAMLTNELQTE